MIYVASASVKHKQIRDAVQDLVDRGFRNIELTGGTNYYDGFEDDLLFLKDKYQLNYICHNYFPPPKEHFVLNLASQNDVVYNKSIEHFLKAINLSKKIGATKYAFHAGFLIDIKTDELGKKIGKSIVQSKAQSIKRFCAGFNIIKEAAHGVELYIENNVLSNANSKTYTEECILMLTNYNDYLELKQEIDFKLLLDVAHLKVSSRSLGLNFASELRSLIQETDYLHVSDNDELEDSNNGIYRDSSLAQMLSEYELKKKTITLEVYNIQEVVDSYNVMNGLINEFNV